MGRAKLVRMDHVTKEAFLQRYAFLAVHVGVGLKPGQRLVIRTPLDAAPLVRHITAAAYQAGAPYVNVMWSDPEVAKARFLNAPEDSFEEVPYGNAAALEGMALRGDAFIAITGEDPEALKEADPARVSRSRSALSKSLKAWRKLQMSDAVPWSVIAAPSPGWARKVFPGVPDDEAMDALWNAIFQAIRLDQEDPVTAWQAHVDALETRATLLNDNRFDALHFRGEGTDLTVGLAKGHIWKAGASVTKDGQSFVANLPTEEVFTAPHAQRVNGTVRASLPLSTAGHLIRDFSMRFEEGRVVEAHAREGQEVLDRMLDMDEGARRLGEVALVSADSPIRKAAELFYNTLFDENAASHIALGEAYRFSAEGGIEASDEEAAAIGLNTSLIHVDFMIGTAEMDVDGVTADGSRMPVMRSGAFVLGD